MAIDVLFCGDILRVTDATIPMLKTGLFRELTDEEKADFMQGAKEIAIQEGLEGL